MYVNSYNVMDIFLCYLKLSETHFFVRRHSESITLQRLTRAIQTNPSYFRFKKFMFTKSCDLNNR